MRLLANENIEQPIVDLLRAEGHDVAYVSEVAPGAPDDEVLRVANAESRLVLTNDKDFGEMAFRERRVTAGIVLLRLQSQDGVEKANRLKKILPVIEEQVAGHFAVVTEERVRLRPLRRG